MQWRDVDTLIDMNLRLEVGIFTEGRLHTTQNVIHIDRSTQAYMAIAGGQRDGGILGSVTRWS